ncbi:MAG: streptogramin lyase [Verrucomicrobiales bacterium]|jgi:streptogramin lyase
MKISILFLAALTVVSQAELDLATIAGTGERGFAGDGGPAVDAKINNPFGVVVGPDKHIYFCDTGNHVVRKIDRETGVISTVAGTGGVKGFEGDGGPATEAKCFEPYEVRFDEAGNLFFVEMQNNIVRRVDAKTGVISTIAGTGEKGFSGDGGPATKATFNRPHSIQFGADGNLYICDIGNHRVRRVDMKSGEVDTLCGTGKSEGPADGAKISPKTSLKGPRALDVDQNGDLWLALREGNAVFRFDMKAGTVHHVAGTGQNGFSGNGGPAKEATLSGPKGISLSPDGKAFLADTESHSVRYIDLTTDPPTLQLLAGDGKKGDGPDGDPLRCRMARLHGIFVDPATGEVFIGDSDTNKVRVVRERR